MAASFSVVSEMHPVVRDEVYRIGCDAIRNLSVHSQTNLQVELAYAGDLILCVHDNCVGIDPAIEDKGKEGHFCLQGMHERARRIMSGSRLTPLRSGTEIKLVVPAASSTVGQFRTDKSNPQSAPFLRDGADVQVDRLLKAGDCSDIRRP